MGQNIAYDACVCIAHRKDLVPLIFEAYANDGVEDVMLREMLLQNEATGVPRLVSLDDLCRKYLMRQLDKDEDGWRLRFWELHHLQLRDWPQRAVDYALGDATAPVEVYHCQDDRAMHSDTFKPSCREARAHVAFTLMAAWGLKTDVRHVEDVRQGMLQMQAERRDELIRAGIMRPTKEERAALAEEGITDLPKGKPHSIKQAAMVAYLFENDADLPETPASTPEKPKYSLSQDVLATLNLPLADTYLEYKHDSKMLSAYLSKYMSGLVQCSVNPLLTNGRKSLLQPSLQNLPTKGPLRESFVARPGKYFCAVDYAGIELRTAAQVDLWLVGYSRMAELFQQDPDADLHSRLAATIMGISEDEGMRLKAIDDPAFKEVRNKQAKRCIFGLAGGMGLKRFNETLLKEKVVLPWEQLERMKEAYLTTFPEKRDYFQMVSDMLPRRKHPNDKPKTRIKGLVSGMYRGNVGYCQIANGYFSELMASGSADATWRIVRACYDPSRRSVLFGARVVNAVHDENIVEVDRDGAHEQGEEIARIMVETMQSEYTPDIPISAEPALMERWYKDAWTVRDGNGRLALWTPDMRKD